MAPTWSPKRSQNGEKIEAEIDQNCDASWGRNLKDFGGFGKAKWSQVGTGIGSKIDPNFERRRFEKTLFFLRKNNDFEGSGGRSWDQKSIKNRSKNDVILGRYLGIDFSWILVDLGGHVGATLGLKIDKKSIQKGIEKQMRKRRRKNRQRSASWAVLARKGRRPGQATADTRGPV